MNKLRKRNILILTGIIILGFLLRFISIEHNPPSMHADEADTGYTALTLIKTGMDPYGNSWPLHFQDQAYNFRAPLYTYATIPFVYLLGLNVLSERLPSVLFGVMLIACVYLLLKEFFKNEDISLLGAFLMAINPWGIHLSRTGLEVMLSVLLTTSGILLFEISKRKKYFLILSTIAFSLFLFSYHPAKIFVPLIICVLVFLNFKNLIKKKFELIVSIVIMGISVLVIGHLAINGKGAAELHNVSIFDNERAGKVVDMQRTNTEAPLSVSSLFSNKIVYYIREFSNVYAGPLSFNYLFLNGENNLDKGIGNYGQFHLFEFPAFIIGVYAVWKKNRKLFFLSLIWFFLALIPGGITKTGNYAYRDVNAIVPPLIFTSAGFVSFYSFVKRNNIKFVIGPFIIIAASLFVYFIYNYYFSYPVYSRDWWGFSQKEALDYAINIPDSTPVVIHGGLDWAVLYAFYNNLEPVVFQKAYNDSKSVNFVRFENIYIGNVVRDDGSLEYDRRIPQKAVVIVPYGMTERTADKVFRAADGGSNLSVYDKTK